MRGLLERRRVAVRYRLATGTPAKEHLGPFPSALARNYLTFV